MAHGLETCRVMVCVGGGGVGKTTTAAALAYREALKGRRVLVLTVDPARRLADALGLKPQMEEQPVAIEGSGSLSADMVDALAVLRRFIERASPRPEIARRLVENRLFQELAAAVSGSQEFAALERLLVAVESGQYDLVVLDTPPTQHALDFLRAPERIYNLFQESVTRWFTEEQQNEGLVRRLFHQGTRRAVDALEYVTGSGFFRELTEFFGAMAQIQKSATSRSVTVHRLLAAETTAFILVTAYDDGKINEAMEFAAELQSQGHHLRAIVVNRAIPEWLDRTGTERISAAGDENLQLLVDFHDLVEKYYSDRKRHYRQMFNRLQDQVQILEVPEQKDSIDALAGLKRIARILEEAQ